MREVAPELTAQEMELLRSAAVSISLWQWQDCGPRSTGEAIMNLERWGYLERTERRFGRNPLGNNDLVIYGLTDEGREIIARAQPQSTEVTK